MEEEKAAAVDLASGVQNLRLVSTPKIAPSQASSFRLGPLNVPSQKNKPRRLVSLCLGVIGRYFEDIIEDLADISSAFPPHAKLALTAIARRRQLLNDHVLLALAECSWVLLDISGSDVSDFGLTKIAEMCPNIQAVDISRCDKITASGVSALISNCQTLEILRLGGSPRSEFTARSTVNLLKPELNDIEGESWEELDGIDIGKGAPSLRWLIWPKIDDDSRTTLATECPRIALNPKPSPIGFWGQVVPPEALPTVSLDHSVVEDIDPKTWAVSGAASRRSPVLLSIPTNNAPELSVAEKFRLAFLERDTRMAPKRAKNERQRRRRAEREWLLSSSDAKAAVLASQASKSLRNK